jgi:hypothetical protein
MQTSVTASRSTTILGLFMVISSTVLITLTPSRKDSILGIAETFHVISEAFIMLLLDGLQGFSCGWMLVCALEVANEHGT